MSTILVPVDGSPAAFRALEVACEDARRTTALLSVIYVIEVPRSHPVDAELPNEVLRAEAVLSHAETIAQRHGVATRCGIFQSRDAGSVVVDEAEAQGVDAIVIGLHDHRPYGRFELSTAALYVLANATCEVRVVRPRQSVVALSAAGFPLDAATSTGAAPEGTALGRSAPGRSAPGRSALGSATPGSATPGSATPGSATPGSATPGSATPGSATPGRAIAGGGVRTKG